MSRTRLIGLIALLAAYLACDVRAVRVWRSDLALWTHAEAMGPSLLRPRLNREKARFVWAR